VELYFDDRNTKDKFLIDKVHAVCHNPTRNDYFFVWISMNGKNHNLLLVSVSGMAAGGTLCAKSATLAIIRSKGFPL